MGINWPVRLFSREVDLYPKKITIWKLLKKRFLFSKRENVHMFWHEIRWKIREFSENKDRQKKKPVGNTEQVLLYGSPQSISVVK